MEEYMKTLLEQIRCKSARKLVEKEIREHILEQYEENLEAGMDESCAMEAAVEDMGSPVETGVALDAIHRPQMSWSMLVMIGVISFFSILIQVLVGNGNPMLGSGHMLKHGIHVMIGFAMMLLVYRLDYSKIGRYAKRITGIACTVFLAAIYLGITASVNGAQAWIRTPFAPLSIPALLLFAVPLYGGILYSYYGTEYTGLFKSIFWMIPPIWVAFLVPKISLAVMLLFLQGILLSVALWKNWFQVKKYWVLGGFWGSILTFPVILVMLGKKFGWIAQYQMERLALYLGQTESDTSSAFYFLRDGFKEYRLWGAAEIENPLMETGQSYFSDFLISFVGMNYGILAAVLLILLILAVIVKGISIVVKQKNKLGRIMGIGCGIVFLGELCLHVFTCIGWFPPMASFLPFFSYGGSNLVVFYMMLGLMLSIYRYKNILPSTGNRKKRPMKRRIAE